MSLDHASDRPSHPLPLSDASRAALQSTRDQSALGGAGDRADSGDGIYPLGWAHLSPVAHLFRDVFPDNPLALLGHDFVQALLGSFLATPGGYGLIYVRTGDVAGFVIGSEDSQRHRQNLLRGHWPSLLCQLVWALLRYPSCVRPVAGYLRSVILDALQWSGRGNGASESLPPASLVFLGVDPRYRRAGIATLLTEAFLRVMSERGVAGVKLVVSATNRGALRFYLRRGWRHSGSYPTPTGGVAYRLTYDLRSREAASSEREGQPEPTDLD